VPTRLQRAWAAGLGAVVPFVALVGGCQKTMTVDDCDRIGRHIREVWDDEMEVGAPEPYARSARAVHAIKSEGDRMETEWRSICERELEGRKVDTTEVECILGAKTTAAIQDCAATKKK
jgi:hypothetical protein